MKHNSVRCNLLAEGPNKLKVGDNVRLRSGAVARISTVTSEGDWLGVPQPIGGHCADALFRKWYTNGNWVDVSGGAGEDIIGIIRPGRTESITEENERELRLVREKRDDNDVPNILPTVHDYGW